MRDQAEKLRMKMLESQGALGRSIAVVSGKGGVGKSNFSTNFATLLAQEGKKVVIVDMDIGMGNIHILIGKSVQYSLKDYLEGDLTIEEVMFEGPNGLKYISGGSGMSELMEWSGDMFDRLIQAFEQLQKSFDYILFDMGLWCDKLVIRFTNIRRRNYCYFDCRANVNYGCVFNDEIHSPKGQS